MLFFCSLSENVFRVYYLLHGESSYLAIILPSTLPSIFFVGNLHIHLKVSVLHLKMFSIYVSSSPWGIPLSIWVFSRVSFSWGIPVFIWRWTPVPKTILFFESAICLESILFKGRSQPDSRVQVDKGVQVDREQCRMIMIGIEHLYGQCFSFVEFLGSARPYWNRYGFCSFFFYYSPPSENVFHLPGMQLAPNSRV